MLIYGKENQHIWVLKCAGKCDRILVMGRLRLVEAEAIRREVEGLSEAIGLRYSLGDMGYIGIVSIENENIRITRYNYKVLEIILKLREGECQCEGSSKIVEDEKDGRISILVSKLKTKGLCIDIEKVSYRKYTLTLTCNNLKAEINNLTKEGLLNILNFLEKQSENTSPAR